jgi:Flp pilus assembly protein TadD
MIIKYIGEMELNKARKIIRSCYKNNYKMQYYYLGLTFCSEKQYTRALCMFKASETNGLNNGLLYYNMGVAYLELKETCQAEMNFIKAISLDNYHVNSYMNLGYIYCKSGDFKSAYRILKSGAAKTENPSLIRISDKIYSNICSV